jgi:23S rRNA pseudouridine2605 synthase
VAERLQKILAASGVASRRQAEEWIRDGRVTVNGRPAELGQRVDEDDAIAVDGRRLRRERAAPAQLVLMYHRPAGEPLRRDPSATEDVKSTYERLPPARGRRWLPLSPLAPTDGGLEVFTTDGELRAAASRLAHEVPIGYAVRVRGTVDQGMLDALPAEAAALDPPLVIEAARLAGGEGRNHWLELDVRGARGRDLRTLLLDRGLEVSRLMRTRFGPVRLDSTIARARHRELVPDERDTLYEAMGLARPERPPRPGRIPRSADERRAGRGEGRDDSRGEGRRPATRTGGTRGKNARRANSPPVPDMGAEPGRGAGMARSQGGAGSRSGGPRGGDPRGRGGPRRAGAGRVSPGSPRGRR